MSDCTKCGRDIGRGSFAGTIGMGSAHKQCHEHWNTEKIFFTVDDWDVDVGDCLFFKHDAGEPAQVTNPLSSDWDEDYFTHFMMLPNELKLTKDYVTACIKSGMPSDHI